MTSGYGNADAVANQCFRDGYFRSGDVGYLDDDGYLFICGRKTLFINVSGNKVDPGEVERVVGEHPDVDEVVVVGVTDPHGRELVKAVVVTNAELTAEAVIDWCYGKLVDYKMPRVVEFRDEIPKSPLGKILRKYLQDEM